MKKAYMGHRMKSWLKLSPEEKVERVRSLEVLRLMRDGKSLAASSKSIGIKPETVKRNLGRFIYKRKGRWHAKKTENNIQREMQIYEKGRVASIIVKNSVAASLIGRYMNDVKRGLYYGEWSALGKYKRRIIADVKGKRHRLETRPEAIKEIELSMEDTEFIPIYDVS